jgi:hypothetical protein
MVVRDGVSRRLGIKSNNRVAGKVTPTRLHELDSLIQ